MSPARPPEGAHTGARTGAGLSVTPARPPEGARAAARTGEGSSTSPSLQIYFIRHGETAWSVTGQHTGRTDLALTPHGSVMAAALAPQLALIDFTAVFTSPRHRARRTCELAGLSAVAQIDAELTEWDYGDYEGLRSAEIRQQHPDWNVWADGCPNGETPDAISERADRVIARLSRCSGPVAVFSHGQFGRVVVARWIGLPAAWGEHFTMDPASVGILGLAAAEPHAHEVSLWNFTGALD